MGLSAPQVQLLQFHASVKPPWNWKGCTLGSTLQLRQEEEGQVACKG